MRASLMLLVAFVIGGLAANPVAAHIQVRPTVAAPDDPVMFQVVVPNETEASTTSIQLKIPSGILPFSFEDTPGWKREVSYASNGSIDSVEWTGRLAKDGLVRFTFLASTPSKPGPIEWKAIQKYSDGEEAAWIGAPGSESPAAVTEIRADAPRENAGGEGESAQPGRQSESAETPTLTYVALVLGAVGALLGLAALLVTLISRRPRS